MSYITIRAVAEYQMMTDGDPGTIMRTRLEADDRIEAHRVTGIYPGGHGLVLITFTADMVTTDAPHKDAAAYAENVLNAAIMDTDVDVRWVCLASDVDDLIYVPINGDCQHEQEDVQTASEGEAVEWTARQYGSDVSLRLVLGDGGDEEDE